MATETSRIVCPNCGENIDVNEILYHQLDSEIRKKYKHELMEDRAKLKQTEEALKAEKAAMASEKAKLDEIVADEIRKGVRKERAVLEKKLRKDTEEEHAEQLKALQDELSEKSNQVKELNKSKADVARLVREKEELREKIELETQTKLTARLTEERNKIRQAEESKAKLQISERDYVINQLKEQLQEAQRKAEQGSTQLQGEVQELAIEEWLADNYPLDTIDEIKKGVRGGDCIQTVHTHSRKDCGSIYYESKRTKAFQPSWIEKFKSDIREKNADIGVLVTDAMPADMERFGLKDGIWICSFEEFKGLSCVLRESIVRISRAAGTQENKGDKMVMLYDFLTGNEFRLQVEAIVEGFTQMKSDLDSEKRAMTGIWKKREKQIDKVLLNTNNMYNSVKGIAGNAIPSVPLLELPGDEYGELEKKAS